MTRAKIAITIDQVLLESLDDLIKNNTFQNRSQAINEAIKDKLSRIHKTRLETECKKLIVEEEQEFAEIGLEQDSQSWPQY